MCGVPYSDKSCHIPGWAQHTVEVVSPGLGCGVSAAAAPAAGAAGSSGGGGGVGGVALCVWARRLTVTHRSHTINSSSGARPVAKPNTSTGRQRDPVSAGSNVTQGRRRRRKKSMLRGKTLVRNATACLMTMSPTFSLARLKKYNWISSVNIQFYFTASWIPLR